LAAELEPSLLLTYRKKKKYIDRNEISEKN